MSTGPFFKIFGKYDSEIMAIAGRGEYLTTALGSPAWNGNLLYTSYFDVRFIDHDVVIEGEDPYINQCDFINDIYNINDSWYSFANGVINVTGIRTIGMGINTYIDLLGGTESHPYLNVKAYGIQTDGTTITIKNAAVPMALDTGIRQYELFSADLTQYDMRYIVFDINNKDVTLPSAWPLTNKNSTKLAFYAYK